MPNLPELTAPRYARTLRWMGHAYFLTLLLYAVLFYKERLLNFDSSYYLFNLIYDEDFFIVHKRPVSVLSQWAPLLALKMGASLKTIMIVFSAAFMLAYYGLFNLVVYGFRNAAGGIALAFSATLFVRFKFYAGISEVLFSLAVVGVLVGWVTRDRIVWRGLAPWKDFLVVVGLALAAVLTHPICIIAFFPVLAFDLAYHGRWKDGWNWGAIVASAAVFFSRLVLIRGGEDDYEKSRLDRFNASLSDLTELFDLHVWDTMQYYFRQHYAFPALVGLTFIGVLIWRGRWLAGLVALGSTLAIVLLVMIIYSDIHDDVYLMIDGYLALVGPVLALPLTYGLLRSRHRWLALGLTVGLLVFTLHRLYVIRTFYVERGELVTQLIERNARPDRRKLVLPGEVMPWKELWFRWAIPYETMLRTSLEGPEHTVLLYVARPNQLQKALEFAPDRLTGDNRRIERLNPRYFSLDKSPPLEITNFPPGFREDR